MDVVICETCAVEHEQAIGICRICADERQWMPAEGQRWTSLSALSDKGTRVELAELEPGLIGLTAVVPSGSLGIGQEAKLVVTPAGNVLWDPLGYVDEAAVAAVREHGDVVAVVPSHPHMFGVQVEWSRALGGVPVLVAEPDADWVTRPDPVIETWSGDLEVVPGVTLTQPGGHFPGSAVAHWAAGAEGRGVLLSGDTIFANPDRTASFMRSYPNRIPLSANVVERIAEHVGRFAFDRLYNNFDGVIPVDARAVVQRSAARHASWVRGEFDHLT